ncbi:MAG: hypothetical protein HQ495_14785 [Alphaproteobacteria bacterium]|nr:hypothetical protein [Alphaproteobacteria bacterium]
MKAALSSLFILALIGVSTVGMVAPASAQGPGKPNIIVVGEDADEDSVPRFSRIFQRVQDALIEELNIAGFDVFDETAASLGNFAQDRLRRTDAELIDIARSVTRPPIDVAVIFTIFASVEELRYTTRVRARVTGRLLNVKTGRRLGNFEVDSPRAWNAPVDCPRDCILETVGRYSKVLAEDVGDALSIKLADLVDGDDDGNAARRGGDGLGGAFTLVFNGFDADEILDVEEFLVVFGGYKRYRPVFTGGRHREYWYETDSTSARLNRNLEKMLDHLDVRGQVGFSGNEFRVTKIRARRGRKVDADDFE